MLLGSDQHLEAAFTSGRSPRDDLGGPFRGEFLYPVAPTFALIAQHRQDLVLGKPALFVGREFGEEPAEVEALHRSAPLLFMNVKIEERHRSHVKKGFAHGT